MTDNIEEMGKDDLIAYAELHGVEIDKRWNAARIREAITKAGEAPALTADAIEVIAPQILTRQVVASDMTKLDGFTPDAPEAPRVAAVASDAFNLDGAVSIWAESWANGLDRAWAEFDGPVFRVTVRTKHGQTVAELLDVEDTEAGVMAALEIAKAKMIGGGE